jgi:hypothetical protein
MSLLEHRGFLPREREFSFRQKKLHRGPVGVSREWHEDNEHLGAIHRPEGARRFSPGFQPWEPAPPGRRALKGRQIRPRRNGRQEHIYLGAAIAPFCAGAHDFSHWEIVSLPNKYSLPFSLAIGRIWST